VARNRNSNQVPIDLNRIFAANNCFHAQTLCAIVRIEPGKRGGKPCIRGMRITVYDVLEYLASGMTQDENLKDFPYLTKEDILASLGYSAEHGNEPETT
jgi:uncharacterized protein (DUF433 family)